LANKSEASESVTYCLITITKPLNGREGKEMKNVGYPLFAV
jgi:hypothetical protein